MVAGSSTTQGAAVITGVGGGIGRALAERLAGQGRQVLGVSRDLGGWAARAALPAGFDVVAANLSTSEGIAQALEPIHDVAEERGERIDILVHCAGTVGAPGPVYERTEDEIDTMLTLHAKAPLLLTTGLSDVLSSGARVLSISTRAAHATLPGVALYAMAKHAQHSVTTSLRLELAPEVLVASAIPGEVDTEMQANLRAPDPGVFALAEFFPRERAQPDSGRGGGRLPDLVADRDRGRRVSARVRLVHLRPVVALAMAAAWARVHLSGAALGNLRARRGTRTPNRLITSR